MAKLYPEVLMTVFNLLMNLAIRKKSMLIFGLIVLLFPMITGGIILYERSLRTESAVIISVIKSNKRTRFQLFYQTHKKFNKYQSIHKFYREGEYQQLRFAIPDSAIKKLRIDPGGMEISITISQISLIHRGKRTTWRGEELTALFEPINDIDTFELRNGLLYIHSSGKDPYFISRGNLVKTISFTEKPAESQAPWVIILVILSSATGFLLIKARHKLASLWQITSETISSIHAQTAFLMVGSVWGVITLIFLPPFQSPDEHSHFCRAYQVSKGVVFPTTDHTGIGGDIPVSYLKVSAPFKELNFHPENKTSTIRILEVLRVPLNENVTRFISFPNTARFTPFSYLPQSSGIFIGRIFEMNVIYLLYLGRLFNLIFWLLLVYAAIRITPVYRWLFVLVALTPMSLAQAASTSADTLSNGSAFLLTAMIFRIAYDRNHHYTIGNAICLAIVAFLLSITKYAYCFIALLVLVIPSWKAASKRKYLINHGIVLGGTLIALIAGGLFVRHVYDLLGPDKPFFGPKFIVDVNPSVQFSFIINHLLSYIYILFNTISRDYGFIVESFIGKLGWLDTKLPDYFIIAFLCVLTITALVERDPGKNIPFWHKMVMASIIILVIGSVYTLNYLTWNPVGASYVGGIQGRYFIPISPLIFALLYNQRSLRIEKFLGPSLFIFLILTFTITTISITERYYFD